MYRTALFIFRRDLRLEDNTALNAALQNSKSVIPIFIFDPRQVGTSNQYRSTACIQFMIESLIDLEHSLHRRNGKLFLFYGTAEKVINRLIKIVPLDALYVNKDYTPFASQRDAQLASICIKHGIAFHAFDDLVLHAPHTILNSEHRPYHIFTSYYKKAVQIPLQAVILHRHTHFFRGKLPESFGPELYTRILPQKRWSDTLAHRGGRSACKQLLRTLPDYRSYVSHHNMPAFNTTHISPYIKFTTYSPREFYAILTRQMSDQGTIPTLVLRQLYWRDFFTMIAFFFPEVFGSEFQEKYRTFPWSYHTQRFERWCTGTTGFPIVDAGMRQLNETGWMHNRVRLITASFLIKDLHIDWQWGERYFAQHLIDYDPAVNNGNWQWVAGTGCDSQPYFRIFNPWLQQKKYDPVCEYIYAWIPELRSFEPRIIHRWYDPYIRPLHSIYPKPMVDHAKESQKTIERYKQFLYYTQQ